MSPKVYAPKFVWQTKLLLPFPVPLHHCTTHFEDVGKLALSVRDVSSVPPAEGNDALLQVAE